MSTRKTNGNGRKLSSRLIRKGALIQETYEIFKYWDFALSLRENLTEAKMSNIIGAKNESWLREVIATISSRFTNVKDIEPLVFLAKGNFPLDKWRSCFYWHVLNTDELYYRFATEWLFNEFASGTYLLRTESVTPFVRKITDGKMASGNNLSEYGVTRAARDLLLMASNFGLLAGSYQRKFTSYHITDESILYVLHGIADVHKNALLIVKCPDWQAYLMSPSDVERELFRLHQFRHLRYDVAGSIAQLTLPYSSLTEYARSLVA